MGNDFVKADKNGIIDYGHEEYYSCNRCNNNFIRSVGVKTIKGPSHPKLLCPDCIKCLNQTHNVIFNCECRNSDFNQNKTSVKFYNNYLNDTNYEICQNCIKNEDVKKMMIKIED